MVHPLIRRRRARAAAAAAAALVEAEAVKVPKAKKLVKTVAKKKATKKES
mgnify:CR=1 FL=1|tara:strand:+ start:408 stop:557 length:150 start_codon:yes stop_codon:yes gene_type:complete